MHNCISNEISLLMFFWWVFFRFMCACEKIDCVKSICNLILELKMTERNSVLRDCIKVVTSSISFWCVTFVDLILTLYSIRFPRKSFIPGGKVIVNLIFWVNTWFLSTKTEKKSFRKTRVVVMLSIGISLTIPSSFRNELKPFSSLLDFHKTSIKSSIRKFKHSNDSSSKVFIVSEAFGNYIPSFI